VASISVKGARLVNPYELAITVSCKRAACSGSIEVEGRVSVRVREDEKTLTKRELAVIGSHRFLLAGGKSVTVDVELDHRGRALLSAASPAHPTRLIVVIDESGETHSASLRVS